MTEYADTLPQYQAKRSESFPSFLVVRCPYDNCPSMKDDRPFLVAEKTWLRPNRLERTSPTGKSILITGRSCPYCFRTARLPKRSQIQ